ncbi:acylphosphatase [Pelagibius litoralis]|uniref:Acylphosphatase n=1 Tax=Pelagibius litoralis TaxID=374515 RepID=A0A967F2R9_9PROT|nr:acylphosphatase [Pelagibius litoralis]NIA72131.1 acylphosphatase [Pelagibius litoralis]
MTKALHVVISGRVQGVWFRGWTRQAAASFGLDGWVRNRRDGSVEAVFSGDAKKVEAMLQACWQGPDRARVTTVDSSVYDDKVEPGFVVKTTA